MNGHSLHARGIEGMYRARRYKPCLYRICKDGGSITYQKVKQGQAHLARLAQVKGAIDGKLRGECANDPEPYRVVRKNVIAQAEQERFAWGDRCCAIGVH